MFFHLIKLIAKGGKRFLIILVHLKLHEESLYLMRQSKDHNNSGKGRRGKW